MQCQRSPSESLLLFQLVQACIKNRILCVLGGMNWADFRLTCSFLMRNHSFTPSNQHTPADVQSSRAMPCELAVKLQLVCSWMQVAVDFVWCEKTHKHWSSLYVCQLLRLLWSYNEVVLTKSVLCPGVVVGFLSKLGCIQGLQGCGFWALKHFRQYAACSVRD